MARQRLLCITAHPDDEAGGFGGSLLLYRERGAETYVICLTPGQAATHRGGNQSPEALADVRRQEFAASCKVLQVTHGEVLNFPDAGLDRVDVYLAVGELVSRIRRIQPDIIMTFGPEGAITAHPDHSMASMLATMAYHWAGRSNRYPEQLNDGVTPHRTAKLYYATAHFTLENRQPVSLPPSTAMIDIGPYLETKIRAFKAHQTQSPLFELFEGTVRKRGLVEMFHLAASIHPGPITQETDLFTGIES